jgi:hypothetical protein
MVVITPNSMSKFEIGFLEHHLRYSRKSMNLPCVEIYGVGGVEFFWLHCATNSPYLRPRCTLCIVVTTKNNLSPKGAGGFRV